MTGDGGVFVHRRAFLHVANRPFVYHRCMEEEESGGDGDTDGADGGETGGGAERNETTKGTKQHLEDEVHLTNCCANSNDPNRFLGEICADLATTPLSSTCTTSSKQSERFTHHAIQSKRHQN